MTGQQGLGALEMGWFIVGWSLFEGLGFLHHINFFFFFWGFAQFDVECRVMVDWSGKAFFFLFFGYSLVFVLL